MNRFLAWFAENSVVANLLMVLIVAAGLLTIPRITKEIFPEVSIDMISVSVRYLGAAPEEVEEGVTVRVEEAIQDLEGIERMTSTSSEGVGTVIVELESGTDGFVLGVMRGMVRERKSYDASLDAPYLLSRREDGRLLFEDPLTGRVIDLRAFGVTNAAAFAKLLRAAILPQTDPQAD